MISLLCVYVQKKQVLIEMKLKKGEDAVMSNKWQASDIRDFCITYIFIVHWTNRMRGYVWGAP